MESASEIRIGNVGGIQQNDVLVTSPATDLTAIRRFYAEEIQAVANIQSARLVEAFATVPREHYVGPGPWQVLTSTRPSDPRLVEYRVTPDNDPRHIYHNVVVGLDVARGLNNGQPSALAMWIDCLGIEEGEAVLHVGCGVGYYTAIMCCIAGHRGKVVGVEVEDQLAARAKANLRHLRNAEVVHGDATTLELGSFDAIFINAGVNDLPAAWLNALRPGGRMILPLTTASAIPEVGSGLMMLIKNVSGSYSAQFTSSVMVFNCAAARSAEMDSRLKNFFAGGEWKTVQSLRRDLHDQDESCRLHTEHLCLSSATANP